MNTMTASVKSRAISFTKDCRDCDSAEKPLTFFFFSLAVGELGGEMGLKIGVDLDVTTNIKA